MLANEDEGWYVGLARDTAYNNLLDRRPKHLKSVRVCGRSKPWWNGKIKAQLSVEQNHRQRLGPNGDWIMERYRLRKMIQEAKLECWEAFCTECGERSLWEVVRWTKAAWRLKERIGRLRGDDGRWLESEEDKLEGLVQD